MSAHAASKHRARSRVQPGSVDGRMASGDALGGRSVAGCREGSRPVGSGGVARGATQPIRAGGRGRGCARDGAAARGPAGVVLDEDAVDEAAHQDEAQALPRRARSGRGFAPAAVVADLHAGRASDSVHNVTSMTPGSGRSR